jgi:hypothetical protein
MPKEKNTQLAKILPIWSPCLRSSCSHPIGRPPFQDKSQLTFQELNKLRQLSPKVPHFRSLIWERVWEKERVWERESLRERVWEREFERERVWEREFERESLREREFERESLRESLRERVWERVWEREFERESLRERWNIIMGQLSWKGFSYCDVSFQ